MVWKKNTGALAPAPLEGEAAALAESLAPPAPLPRERQRAAQPAPPGDGLVLGPSIAFQGELSGTEDVTLAGACSGRVSFPGHRITVASGARVEADLEARVIVVEGEVRGNLRAGEQAFVRATGLVHGDITAPRVVLDDGGRVEGKITMGTAAG